MGSASSKAARKLSREQPSWAGSRVQPRVATTEHAYRRPLAFESKDGATEREAKDPHLVEKLSRLGQVRVDDHHRHHDAQTVRAASDAQTRMYRSRIRSEAEASSPSESVPSNRLLASLLTELLEGRKSVTSDVELETLAKRHRIDPATLRRLGRIVNTPSVDESTVIWATDEHGEESVTMMARWVDPVLSRA